ncbi:DUF721 domain-containing protein (plasmid) [Streptomyces seoulensis]|uniref:DUF721 domain-containing protein n=1 Tax=Streptomyces seoulensis TaxID=73044 RepID=A0A4P6U2Z4_STRSO|nr:DUF721 domain-containing protein [Streptomyces seoulensis]QBJ94495.1 DUF721 domain-containing protein [Streptomyces seoulensis]
MTDTPQLSGKDLARQALETYKAATRTYPGAAPAKPKRRRPPRNGEGREPVSLATAIANLHAEAPMEAGLAGGSIHDQWPSLCPQYIGHVEPAHYEDQTGRLDLRPASHAYAAQLRLLGGQLAKQINDKLGRPVVRTIRVLPVANLTTAAAALPDAPKPQPGPVRTRETASPGYRQTLAAALQHQPTRPSIDPYLQRAMRRQEAALRANRQPEPAVDLEQAAARQVDRSDASHRAALARKRQEASGTAPAPRRAFDVA